ncbi:DUF192 domain-containing protein [Candidatus Micrarchaeota archaeon]|nr:DUF192 domain-containing protein [Candidatus Micrarchaeota archaeon]
MVEVVVDEVAGTLLSQVRGLMFRRKRVNILFVFNEDKICPIHSWFVFYPFDAVYLDRNFRVVEIFRDVKPFSYVRPTRPSSYLLEVSHHRPSLRVGDRIVIKTR